MEVINISNKESFCKVIPPEDFIEPYFTEETFKESFEKIDFFAYFENSKILGVAGLQIDESGQGWVRLVYILPEHQRKGIGNKLVERIEQEAQKKGLQEITLYTFDKAIWAVRFYEKLGYEIIGKGRNPWGYHLMMRKRFLIV
jgi:GNAT superfamily N-acetyltransferase